MDRDRETGSVVKGWVMLHRPFMLILVMLGMVVGYLLTTVDKGVDIDYLELVIGLLGALFVTMGTDVVNEAYDCGIDSINKPYRPIPSGIVSVRTAFILSYVYYIIGISIGFFISWYYGLFLLFISLLTWHYSWKGKTLWYAGIIESPLGASLIPYAGGLITGDYTTLIPLVVFIYVFETGRDFLLYIEDMEADTIRCQTIVHKIGPGWSVFMAFVFYLVAYIIVWTPWFHGGYSDLYLIGSSVLIGYLIFAWGSTDNTEYKEELFHLYHRNIARVFIALYQVVLIVESFIS